MDRGFEHEDPVVQPNGGGAFAHPAIAVARLQGAAHAGASAGRLGTRFA